MSKRKGRQAAAHRPVRQLGCKYLDLESAFACDHVRTRSAECLVTELESGRRREMPLLDYQLIDGSSLRLRFCLSDFFRLSEMSAKLAVYAHDPKTPHGRRFSRINMKA